MCLMHESSPSAQCVAPVGVEVNVADKHDKTSPFHGFLRIIINYLYARTESIIFLIIISGVDLVAQV